jgi:hypothetical protein
MKTFFVKKAKGAKPVVGASVLEKKPSVGEYINFNVPTDVKILCELGGEFPLLMLGNAPVAADSIQIYIETVQNGGVEYSYVELYFSIVPYDSIHTVNELLEAANKRAGGMVHFVLEDGLVYVTKNGFTSEINSVGINAVNY